MASPEASLANPVVAGLADALVTEDAVAAPMLGVVNAREVAKSAEPTVAHVGGAPLVSVRTNWLVQVPAPGMLPGIFDPVTVPVAATFPVTLKLPVTPVPVSGAGEARFNGA